MLRHVGYSLQAVYWAFYLIAATQKLTQSLPVNVNNINIPSVVLSHLFLYQGFLQCNFYRTDLRT